VDVLAYLRVSTDAQGDSGLGLDAQRSAITEEAARRAWNVVEWITDTASGKSLDRPGIREAIERLENGGPKVLVAAKLDRLSRSAIDFLSLVKRAETNGWALVMLDPSVDMTDPMGRFTAGILAQVAELEREMISKRTTDALARARARGTRLGRPSALGSQVAERIEAMRQDGMTLGSIAETLNSERVPTPSGQGQWWPASVRQALRTLELNRASKAA
jgi:DNA invertase Pin-like site-specific DNA recombinase